MTEQILTPYQIILNSLSQQYEYEDWYGEVNLTQLSAHLDQLYKHINELRWRVTELERQQQSLLNQHGNHND